MTRQLPDSWCFAPLSDLVEVNPGIDKAKFQDYDEVPFVPMPAVEAETGRIDVSGRRPFAEVKSGFTSFASGDVLFAKITPCMENGKMAVVPDLPSGVGFGSTEFFVLRPTAAVNAKLLYYFVSSAAFRQEAQHHMTGAVGQKRVPKRYLESVRFPVPPIKEQSRIVEKIEALFAELDKGEESLRQVQTLLARYRQSVLKAAVTGELTADWRARHAGKLEHGRDLLARILKARRENWQGRGKYKEPVEPDTTNLPDLPEGWVWCSLDALIGDGPTNGISPREASGESGCLSFKLTATTSGKFIINADTVKRVDLVPDQDSKYWLKAGDILIQRGNTMEYVGTAAIFPGPSNQYIYPDLMMRIRLVNPALSSWVVSWINFEYARRHFRRLATGIAGNMPKINATTLCSLAVPLPSETELLALSQVFNSCEQKLEHILSGVRAEFGRVGALRQSILKKAFAGKLVAQDPNDESAVELLARIRAQRASREAGRPSIAT